MSSRVVDRWVFLELKSLCDSFSRISKVSFTLTRLVNSLAKSANQNMLGIKFVYTYKVFEDGYYYQMLYLQNYLLREIRVTLAC